MNVLDRLGLINWTGATDLPEFYFWDACHKPFQPRNYEILRNITLNAGHTFHIESSSEFGPSF